MALAAVNTRGEEINSTDEAQDAVLIELAKLRAENEALKAARAKQTAPKPLTFKVSAKGAVSVYGVNARFPVTMYPDQWVRVLDRGDDIRAFIKANADKLSTKPSKETV